VERFKLVGMREKELRRMLGRRISVIARACRSDLSGNFLDFVCYRLWLFVE
jgi:hypothetical protein